ncbi:hypothetical protein LCGC14_0499230 [marine sediment metagenome]|uniref:Uncharacterized protein n=1 Tax=marine sediment metagenome TaxID=412755 RepID=A0A0F9VD04_9ZZZZ
MKRKNQSPREYSLQHCKDRARERYAFELLDNDYDVLCNSVREELVGDCFIGGISRLKKVNQEGSQYTFIVVLRGRELVVVFDAGRSLVTTLLPPEQFSEHLS